MEVYTSFASAGETVAAVLHVPESTPAPGVIMCHGFTGHKAETHRLFVHTARDFAAHGLAVLRFDFRGSGDSAGDFRDMTITREIEDARAALGFLAFRPEADGDRLGVLGLSLGGCVAACTAGRDERVKALVLWAALAHPTRLADRLREAFQGDAQVMDYSGWDIGRGLMEDADTLKPLEEVHAYRGPALILHGTEDESVLPSDAEDFSAALDGRARLHFVSGADHVFSSFPWKNEVITKSRDFFLEHLGR